jgi:hypothetical protein
MTFDLARFCLDHPGACLVPAFHLGEHGMSAEVRAALAGQGGLSPQHLDLFDRGYALYRARAADLHARAPGSWLPPRKAHVLLITDPDRVRPYNVPFLGTSWFLYASDLDPSRSHEEWVAYQIFHVERLSFLQALRAAVGYNLAYFLTRTEAELHDFSRAAARSTRPDSPAFVALARALPWIRSLYHLPLRLPPRPPPEGIRRVDGADLLVPASLVADFQALCAAFETVARTADATFLERQAAVSAAGERAPADEIADFLRDERPDVLVVDASGAVVHDPDQPAQPEVIRRALEPLTPRAKDSLREDLRLVSAKSRAVLASLRSPDRLPRTSSDVEIGGGVYIRADLRRVVYELKQPGFDPLRHEAPPFHRRLLAARTVHEWGHLVSEAGIVHVPPERRTAHEEAVSALADCWAEVVRAMPARLADDVRLELAILGATPSSAGPALARRTLHRISDYTSNLFFRSYLEPEELLAYVLNNARHHLNEGIGPLAQLSRHAVELQYLGLVEGIDPVQYLLDTSYFTEYLLRPGVFTEAHLRAVVAATARVCTCYEIDASALVRPAGNS